MTSQRYSTKILLSHAYLFCQAVGLDFLFMDDNACSQKTRNVSRIVASEGIEFIVYTKMINIAHIGCTWQTCWRKTESFLNHI